MKPFHTYLIIGLLSVVAGVSKGQPAISRGEQRMPISFQEGMNRAYAALQAEGYVNIGAQANMTVGYKGENTAVILVNEATNGTYWINIVVASLTNNAGIPGGERVKLQERMGNPGGGPITNNEGIKPIDWTSKAESYRGKNYQQFRFTCPSSGRAADIWGNGVYTDDSSICTAAVHTGLITFNGGTVTIEIRPGLSSYEASPRNGVTSKNYGGWHGSFVFVR